MSNENVIYEVDVEHNIYPNMTVEKRYYNNEFAGWRVMANDGYVIYDDNEECTEFDILTLKEVPVKYYFAATYKNPRYNWSKFNYVAELREQVDEKYIFDGMIKEVV